MTPVLNSFTVPSQIKIFQVLEQGSESFPFIAPCGEKLEFLEYYVDKPLPTYLKIKID